MQLQVPFVQLPLRFNAQELAAEVQTLGPDAWREHPQKYPGNYALPLIAVNGDPESDAIAGPMRPTAQLQQCPYLQRVLARLDAVWGRTRLMKLTAGAEVTPHADINYYWRDRVRVHVPISTSPEVRFICGNDEVNMAAGECWIFDTWRPHRVLNPTSRNRIHLVADTVGSEAFWNLVEHGRAPGHGAPRNWEAPELPYDHTASVAPSLALESTNVPKVMTPWELRNHVQFIFDNVEPHPNRAAVQQIAGRFMRAWQATWARYGEAQEAWPLYRRALDSFVEQVRTRAAPLKLVNNMRFMETLRAMVLDVALADRREQACGGEVRSAPSTPVKQSQ